MNISSDMMLKVCGMRDAQNMVDVAAQHPDLMGFIFYPGSPRFVGDAFEIPVNFPAHVGRVGVFVLESTDKIRELAKRHGLQFIQLHGGESVAQCAALKQHHLKVIKVFLIGEDFDFNEVREFVPVADYFLFDTKSKTYGGSGITFDWSILDRYSYDIPFFLSGGLTSQNCDKALALQHSKLAGLDFNSGLEKSPGIKDPAKVKEVYELMHHH